MLHKLSGSKQWFSGLVLLLHSCRGGRKLDQLKWLANDGPVLALIMILCIFFLFFLPVLKPQVEAFLSCNIIQEVHDISQMLSVKFMKMAWEIIIKCLDYGFIYKKAWMTAPLCLIWTVWKERNRIAFDNEELSIQRMKNYFVCNFFSWTNLFIDEGLLSLINFVDLIG